MNEEPRKRQKMCDPDDQEKLERLLLSLVENRPDLYKIFENYKNSADIVYHLLRYGLEESDTGLLRRLLNLKAHLKSFELSWDQKSYLLLGFASDPSPENEQIALLLIENGANFEIANASGDTLLYLAVKNHMQELARELLSRGTIIDEKSADEIAESGDETQKWIEVFINGTSNDRLNRNLCAERLLAPLVNNNKMSAFESVLKLNLPRRAIKEIVSLTIIWREVDFVEMLLRYNPHIKDYPQFLFAASKHEDTSICRMLIEHGADVNAPTGYPEQYPIHAACKVKSLKNAHLLMHLGANVSVTNYNGQTPFALLLAKIVDNDDDDDEDANVYMYLKEPLVDIFMKHFAILTFKRLKVKDKDLMAIERHPKSKQYHDYLKELEKMKQTRIHNDNNIPFSCFFDVNSKQLLALVRNNKDFIADFRSKTQERHALFPNYSMQMTHLFQIALRKTDALDFYERELAEIFNEFLSAELPCIIMEKIVGYVCRDELKRIERDYYLFLHKQIDEKMSGYDIQMLL